MEKQTVMLVHLSIPINSILLTTNYKLVTMFLKNTKRRPKLPRKMRKEITKGFECCHTQLIIDNIEWLSLYMVVSKTFYKIKSKRKTKAYHKLVLLETREAARRYKQCIEVAEEIRIAEAIILSNKSKLSIAHPLNGVWPVCAYYEPIRFDKIPDTELIPLTVNFILQSWYDFRIKYYYDPDEIHIHPQQKEQLLKQLYDTTVYPIDYLCQHEIIYGMKIKWTTEIHPNNIQISDSVHDIHEIIPILCIK